MRNYWYGLRAKQTNGINKKKDCNLKNKVDQNIILKNMKTKQIHEMVLPAKQNKYN